MDCVEYQILHRFFEEEHLDSQVLEGEERVRNLKPPGWYGGGKVPAASLYREENKKLLKIGIIPAVDITNFALARVKSLVRTKYDDKVSFRLIPKIMHACERRGIPQNFFPGILLLYLEHCEGCRWRHLLPQILQIKQAGLSKKDKSEEWSEDMHKAVEEFVKESRITPQQRANAKKQNQIYGTE
jgi:hypothetical protein